MRRRCYIYTVILAAAVAVTGSVCVFADDSSNNNPAVNDARLRFDQIRNRAMGYAYYLRSAYLRNSVINNPERRKQRQQAREAIYSAFLYLERALEFCVLGCQEQHRDDEVIALSALYIHAIYTAFFSL